MKASDYIAEVLEEQGVPVVFEMIGGMITHIIDSLHQRGKIQIVSMHHEQAAGFAAEAVGRICGVPGVALATSGPGATNLVTAIGSCYFDSVPTVFITGQVNRSELSGGLPIRQQGFQETDIVSIVKPITKATWMVQEAASLPEILNEAFRVAREGRPGPVLVDIPMDIQRLEVERPASLPTEENECLDDSSTAYFQELSKALSVAKHPLILGGGGIRCADVLPEFLDLIEHLNVPVVHSLMGVDLLPFNHPLRVGMIGTYGNRWANDALMESDLLIVLGSRLDVRQTGADALSFGSGRDIYHIDCDAGQINNRVKECKGLIAHLKAALPQMSSVLSRVEGLEDWKAWIQARAEKLDDVKELSGCVGINPNVFIHQLSRASQAARTILADVGKHQMWAAQSVELSDDQRFLLSGGLGSMGFALPAAIGSAFASKAPVVCVMGDGGAQCNIQELETISCHGLPIKLIVLNNQSLGMVGQFQEDYFESRMQSTVWGYSAPDFEAVAKAYKIDARTVESAEEVSSALKWLWADPNKPALLNVQIDQDTKVYPKAAYGRAINDMDPRIEE